MRIRFLGVLSVAFCFVGVALAQSLDDAIETTRSLLQARLGEGYPGISVAVGVDGEIVYAEAFGYADVAEQRALTTESQMRIGSVSKPVTAAGLMVLVEAGKIDLDVPVQTYVPTFPEKEYSFTVRQLAGHNAGIRHYKAVESFSKEHYPTVLSGLVIFQDDPLLFEPGTDHRYSSYGWNLISAAMEAPAGTDFLAFMDDAVFKPLGMRHTEADWVNRDIPNRVTFYNKAEAEPRVAPMVDNSYKWAGGGFLSTPSDLVRFGMAHLDPGFLSEESLETLFTSQTLKNGKATGYGVGWRIQKLGEDGPIVYRHGGSSTGGKTSLILVPEARVVTALLANVSRYPEVKRDNSSIAAAFADAVMAEVQSVR